MVARLLWEQDAAGSSPVTSTIILSNRIVMRFVFLLTVFDCFVSKIMLSMLTALLLTADTGGIYVYSNLNTNAVEPY